MKVVFNGEQLRFNLIRGNIRKEVAEFFGESEDDVTDGLVKYDPNYSPTVDTITVDKHASAAYAKYAAIHECICCGRYKQLAPTMSDPNRRCIAIDLMLIGSMSEAVRKEYITKRIEMFETLLEKHLNVPMEPSFEASLETLKSL